MLEGTITSTTEAIDLSTLTGSYEITGPGTYTFTGEYSGTPTFVDQAYTSIIRKAVIYIHPGLSDVTLILNDAKINLTEPQQCPVLARDATSVTIKLRGTNELSANNSLQPQNLYSPHGFPTLWTPEGEGATLTIKDDEAGGIGELTAKGPYCGPGIGKMKNRGKESTLIIESGKVNSTGGTNAPGIGSTYAGSHEGTIIINNGEITAQGGTNGAGIGAGSGSNNGEIIINGGTVVAKGANWAAGIGGGNGGAGGKITITGGNVTATGMHSAAGIGGGSNRDGGTIAITGGTINASSMSGLGIGGGYKNYNFSTDKPVEPLKETTHLVMGPDVTLRSTTVTDLFANGIVLKTDGSGVVTGEVKGAIEYPEDLTIPDNATIFIREDASLSLPSNKTLTNNGKIVICGNGTIDESIITGTVIRLTAKLTEDQIVLSEEEGFTYDGTEKKYRSITVKKNESENYTEGTDYTVTYANNINAGENTATVTIKMKDSEAEDALYGEVTFSFSIAKAAAPTIAEFTAISSPIVYDGTEKTITAPTATGAGTHPVTLYYKLASAGDDTYKKTAPKEVGEYTVKAVCESPNYEEGTAPAPTLNFTITQATDNDWKEGTEWAEKEFSYGQNGYPTKKAKYGVVSYTYYKETEEPGNYTRLEEKPTDVGTWYITAQVIGKESYSGIDETEKVKIVITKATNTWKTPIRDAVLTWVYGSSGYYPTATAQCGTVIYTYYSYDASRDQYVSLDDNKPINAGTWYVTAKVTGTDNYTDLPESNYASFTILPWGLTDRMVTLSPTEYTYDGNKPTITVKQGETILVENTDYTVTWSEDPTGVGTHTVTITGKGNFKGSIEKSYTINARPYIPPTPDPDPIYYTVTIPTEVAGAIIHGGGSQTVEEYTYYTFRIELDPNGNGEYPTVTKGYWWDTLTPDGQGNYGVYVMGNTQITIGEVPTNSYLYYQVTLPTDSVTEAENQYWSSDYIEVVGASPLRAAEETMTRYQAPFGATVTLRPIETERRKFLQWEDGSKQKERTLTLRADQEIKALWQRISPTGIEAIAAGSVIRGERGQLYIEVPEPCDVTLYTYGGVPVRVARLAAGANRLANLNAGLYLVKLGAAPAVPVRVR